jgi:hypothetical protein
MISPHFRERHSACGWKLAKMPEKQTKKNWKNCGNDFWEPLPPPHPLDQFLNQFVNFIGREDLEDTVK